MNLPLSSGDQSKILIFWLLLMPSVVFLVGIIPLIFLCFGLFMMKKNEDFSHIETAVRNCTWYIGLAMAGCLISALYLGSTYADQIEKYGRWYDGDAFVGSCFLVAIALAYLIIVKMLFLNPLRSHSKWVEINGMFSSKPKSPMHSSAESQLDIIKGEKLKHYSVADELIKWAKLKDDGHITEDEFMEARGRLLKKN